MKKLIFITVVLLSASFAIGQNDKPMKKKFAIVIHGGAGTILKKNLTKDQQLALSLIHI